MLANHLARAARLAPATTQQVEAARLRSFTAQVLRALGLPAEQADIGATVIVEADLRGVDSHGVVRLPTYAGMVRRGHLLPDARWSIEHDTSTTVRIDAQHALGHFVTYRAMELAIERARTHGLAAVTIRNLTHNGMNAFYPLMAIEAGLIGVAMTSGPPSVPPFGSVTPALSTNPVSIGAPAGRHQHVLMDMATTVVALGKLRLAATTGRPIPPTWALDRQGQPTSDPTVGLAGFLQWAGGYKGYALGTMVEVLAGVLSGGLYGRNVPPNRTMGEDPLVQSCFLLALQVEAFMPLADFRRRVDELVEDLTSTQPVDPATPVLVAGQPERRTRERRLAEGVPLDAAVARNLTDLAATLGLPSPFA